LAKGGALQVERDREKDKSCSMGTYTRQSKEGFIEDESELTGADLLGRRLSNYGTSPHSKQKRSAQAKNVMPKMCS